MERDLNNYIYSSLPETTNTEYLTEDKDRIRDLFLKNPNISYRSGKIAELCDIEVTSTNISVRKIITELIELEYMPIVSNYKGYKLTLNIDELNEYQASLYLRIKGIQRRTDAIEIIKNRCLK